MKMKNVFQRYEMKYIINKHQKEEIIKRINPYMSLDAYGHSIIRNLYFDTDSYLLIRRSIEKPIYKEKLRIRSYGNNHDKVFVEMKKKYKKVVYKRRLELEEKQAMQWICNKEKPDINSQIAKEIDYAIHYYNSLQPTLYLSYEREAFYSKDGSDFRLTFDENIICRNTNLSIYKNDGIPILDENKILLEIKCIGALPLWMAHILNELKLYKTSFSKYGTAYKTFIFPELRGDKNYGNTI